LIKKTTNFFNLSNNLPCVLAIHTRRSAFVASPYIPRLLHSRALTLFRDVGRAFRVVPDEIVSSSQEYAPEVT